MGGEQRDQCFDYGEGDDCVVVVRFHGDVQSFGGERFELSGSVEDVLGGREYGVGAGCLGRG